jgi:hypothetical protein
MDNDTAPNLKTKIQHMKKLALLFSFGLMAAMGYSQNLNNLIDNRRPGCTSDLSKYMPNAQMFDTVKSRNVADNYLLWDNGETLKVKFMPGGDPQLKDMVKNLAKVWEQHANLKFDFVADDYTGPTNIRVSLAGGRGHNSLVGSSANQVSQSEQTINFDAMYWVDLEYYKNDIKNGGPVVTLLKSKGVDLSQVKTYLDYFKIVAQYQPLKYSEKEVRRTVQHEFGHAIGLLHEQSYPGAIPWNKSDSVYDYYNRTQGWDRRKVDFNVFEVADQMYTNGTSYDAKSIMHYPVEAWQTTNGYTLGRNYDISAGDIAIIKALYPKDKKTSDREVAKITISNLSEMKAATDLARKGISVRPSFDMKTNSKLGEVYFVVRLYYKDGEDYYAVKALGNEYNVNGYCGGIFTARLLPNTTISYNKGSNKNLELFIPFTAIPDVGGKPLIATFNVFLVDTQNGNMTREMYYSVSNTLSLPKK